MSFFLMTLLACASHEEPVTIDPWDDTDDASTLPESDTPPESDTDVALETDTDAPPPGVTVRVEPANPRWDQDLRCVVGGLAPGEAPTVQWTSEGIVQPTMSDGVLPGDTVPHLRQAGGQHWSCSANVGGAEVTSAVVRVEPPVPMVEVEGGVPFVIPKMYFDNQVVLTRTYLIAQAEMSRAQWEQWEPPAPLDEERFWMTNAPEMPLTGIDWHGLMAFAGRLSELDGLEACGTCAMVDGRPFCEAPQDPFSCEGYRLPTAAEWNFACMERGRHADPVPAGGVPNALPDYDGPAPIPLTGPFASPNAVLSDYCRYSPGARVDYLPAASAGLPNALGIVGMCGNAREFVLDLQSVDGQGPFVDPYEREDNPPVGRGRAWAMDGTAGSSWQYVGCHETSRWRRTSNDATLRLVRTLTPPRNP